MLCEAGQAFDCESDVAGGGRGTTILFARKVLLFGLCLRSSLTLVGIAISVFQQ